MVLPSFLQLVVLENRKFFQNQLSNCIYTCTLKRYFIFKVEITLVNSVCYAAECLIAVLFICILQGELCFRQQIVCYEK